jgi:hypothetical protein
MQQESFRQNSEASENRLKAQLDSKLLEAEASRASAEQQHCELEAANQKLRANLNDAASARAAAEASASTNQQQILGLEAALTAEKALQTKMEEDLQAANKEIDHLQAELAGSGARQAHSNAQSDKLRQDTDALQKQVEDTQHAFSESQERLVELTACFDAAQAQAGAQAVLLPIWLLQICSWGSVTDRSLELLSLLGSLLPGGCSYARRIVAYLSPKEGALFQVYRPRNRLNSGVVEDLDGLKD